MSRHGQIRAGMARTLLPFLARYPGVSPEQLLRAAGVAPETLANPEARLSAPLVLALLEEAARATGDEALGIAFVKQLPWSDLGALAYVALHSPTLGAAFGNAARYLAVQQTAGALSLETGPSEASLTYSLHDPDLHRYRQHTEGMLAALARLAREGLGEPGWAPLAVGFRHRPPTDDGPQRRFFGAPVRYRAPANALVLAPADLRRPLVDADPGLLPILLRYAEDCLTRLPAVDDLHTAVLRALVDSIGAGASTIEAVAARLGLSSRSLQRRLKDQGQSFKALVDDARLALSRSYLEDASLSLTEAAFLLGYSDLSAFSRAFHRWTGISPLEFRRRAAARR